MISKIFSIFSYHKTLFFWSHFNHLKIWNSVWEPYARRRRVRSDRWARVRRTLDKDVVGPATEAARPEHPRGPSTCACGAAWARACTGSAGQEWESITWNHGSAEFRLLFTIQKDNASQIKIHIKITWATLDCEERSCSSIRMKRNFRCVDLIWLGN